MRFHVEIPTTMVEIIATDISLRRVHWSDKFDDYERELPKQKIKEDS